MENSTLENDISNFIKDNNYDWTFEEILIEYKEKYTKGFYVSFTCKKIIEKFKDELSSKITNKIIDESPETRINTNKFNKNDYNKHGHFIK